MVRPVLVVAFAMASVVAMSSASQGKPVAAGPNCTTTDTTKNGKPAKCTVCIETK